MNSASHKVGSFSAQLMAPGGDRLSLCGSGSCMHTQKLEAFQTLQAVR